MPENKALDALVKADESTEKMVNPTESKKYKITKRKINSICRNLTMDSLHYSPEKSVDEIEAYIKTKDKMTRIMYSEISNHLFNLAKEDRDIFLTNVEKLLIYSLGKENSISEDAAKIIVKIYDHTQLVNYQIASMNDIFAKRITDAKVSLENELKGIEKEYITILGIFAAIVLAFVGALTFSTSVLNNAVNTGIYKLSVIALIIGFVFYNLVAILLDFLREINDKMEYSEKSKKRKHSIRKVVNGLLFALLLAVFIGYGVTKIKLPDTIYIGTNSSIAQEALTEDSMPIENTNP